MIETADLRWKDPANIDELRRGLAKLFADIGNQTVEPKRAKEMNNAAGKMIGTVRAELDAAEGAKVEPNVPFLNYKKK